MVKMMATLVGVLGLATLAHAQSRVAPVRPPKQSDQVVKRSPLPTPPAPQKHPPQYNNNILRLPPACGPGDKGGRVNPKDAPLNSACKDHDKRYADSGGKPFNNAPFTGTRQTTQADKTLRDQAHTTPGVKARMVETYETLVVKTNEAKFATADAAKEAAAAASKLKQEAKASIESLESRARALLKKDQEK